MSLLYRIIYAIGYTPWENMAAQAPGDTVRSLLAREEEGRLAPFGTALDLGCGSGIWTVELSKRGWDVTGVDKIQRALERARERARAADVLPRFVQGDVTALHAGDIGSGYRLVLDVGCFHGLTRQQQAAEARSVSALAAADATVVLLAIAPAKRRQALHGASQAEVEAAFLGWRVEERYPVDMSAMWRGVRDLETNIYRLRRVSV